MDVLRERIARADPRSPRHWTWAARQHLLRGQVPEAQRALDRALALDPNDARAYALRAAIAGAIDRDTVAAGYLAGHAEAARCPLAPMTANLQSPKNSNPSTNTSTPNWTLASRSISSSL